jgi:hypothetical protein
MIEMREQEKKKLYFKHAIAYTKKKLLQICEFPSLPKPKKKKLPTLECLLTKKALKPYDNKKMLVYQSKRHHKITPILILLYPSILQKSLTKISVAFFWSLILITPLSA